MEDAFIDDIDSIYDGCASLSLGYDSYFILYNDGSYNYHNLPRRLKVTQISSRLTPGTAEHKTTSQEKLKDRAASDPIPELVQLGTYDPDCYFIQFADGKQYWRRLPDELEDILEVSSS